MQRSVDVRCGRQCQYRSRELQRWLCLFQDERLAWPNHSIQLYLVQDAQHGSGSPSNQRDTAVDPFNLNTSYGLAGFDRKFVYNLFFVYAPLLQGTVRASLGRRSRWLDVRADFHRWQRADHIESLAPQRWRAGIRGRRRSSNFFGNGNRSSGCARFRVAMPTNCVASRRLASAAAARNRFEHPSAAVRPVSATRFLAWTTTAALATSTAPTGIWT